MGKKFSKPEMSRRINGDLPSDSREMIETPKRRFDMILLERYPEYSRATIQKFIKKGLASVAGEVVTKANFLVEPEQEDSCTITAPESEK